jgi:lipopolysaccharide export system protein LptA
LATAASQSTPPDAAQPESANQEPEFSTPTSLQALNQQAGASQANLLGEPVTIGYPTVSEPPTIQAPSSEFSLAPAAPVASSSPPAAIAPVAPVSSPPSEVAVSEPLTTYSIEGFSGQAVDRGAEVLQVIDQAFAFKQLPAAVASLEPFIRARSATLAQTAIPEVEPPVLTIPTPDAPFPPVNQPDGQIPETTPLPGVEPPTPPPQPPTAPQPPAVPEQPLPPGLSGVIELSADRQEYDVQRQIFIAEGKVVMRFQGAVLDADRLQVNLNNRIAVAEGNVALRRGEQILRGNRFDYNFVQGTGTILAARGEIFIPSADTDLNVNLANDPNRGTVIGRPASDRITANQPLQVVRGPGGVNIGVGSRGGTNVLGGLGQTGLVNRLRFVADRLEFYPEGWNATNVQITNDPFSPPELVLKTERAQFTRLSPLRDEIRATRPRLVFDQRLAVPIFLSRIVLDRRQRNPPIAQFGYDERDRGGFFIERTFDVVRSPTTQISLTPQIFAQRIFTEGDGVFSPQNYGLRGNLLMTLGPRTTLRGAAVLTSLSPSDFSDRARASLRLNQRIGTHALTLEASYRDRLFNGSLGFQTVQSTIGAVLVSPVIRLGDTGITLTYQAGVQNINANSDRDELLPPNQGVDVVNLTRFQAAASLSKRFFLWQGTALPATATEGLRYTPFPIQPYISLSLGTTGVLTGYSNGDSQNTLSGTISFNAQFGNFSRPFLDYTAINLSYNQRLRGGESPFFFDRAEDRRVLSFGVSQQLYGPFRLGLQGSYSLDNDRRISFDYILEYSRRTYGVVLRYNPELRIGSLNLRVSDFNWTGGTDPFPGSDVIPVEQGIVRTTE